MSQGLTKPEDPMIGLDLTDENCYVLPSGDELYVYLTKDSLPIEDSFFQPRTIYCAY